MEYTYQTPNSHFQSPVFGRIGSLRVVEFRLEAGQGRDNSGFDVEKYIGDGGCGRSIGTPLRELNRTILSERARRLLVDRVEDSCRRRGRGHGR